MIYTIRHSDWSWKIEPEQGGNRFLLRYKKPTDWVQCEPYYNSAEEAAAAVANRKTGVPDWDNLKEISNFPAVSGWLIDPSGSVKLPPAVPDILPS